MVGVLTRVVGVIVVVVTMTGVKSGSSVDLRLQHSGGVGGGGGDAGLIVEEEEMQD